MRSEFQSVKISSICSLISSGGTPSRAKSEYYTNGHVPWLKTKELFDTNIYDTEEYITDLGLRNSSAKLYPPNTVILAMYGATVGKLGIMKNEMSTNQACCCMVVDDKKADYRFLFYSLLQNRNSLINLANGAAQQNLNSQIIKDFEISTPSLSTQKKIAHILSTLDDKIELNRKMNQTLEEMAQALFKSWFVDFDPVHAKMACGNDEELEVAARELGISKEVLELFPSAFEESEFGMIPEGWSVTTIKYFGLVVTGKTPPSKIKDAYNNVGKPFLTPTDIDDSLFVTTTNRHLSVNGEISIKNTIIPAGSICVTCIGSQMGKTIMSPYDACTNQQINSIIVSAENLRNYLFCNLRNRKNEIFFMGSGGSTMPLLNKSSFEKMTVLLPSKKILDIFDIFVKDKLLLVLKNDLQNITLSKTRDALLPKLLSGEVEV